MAYEGIKIFVNKGLKLDKDAYIFQKMKLLFLPPVLGVRGIR